MGRLKGPGAERRGGEGGPSWRDVQKSARLEWAAREREKGQKAPSDEDSLLDVAADERPSHLPGKRFMGVAVMCAAFVLSLLVLIGLEIRHDKIGREVSRLTSRKVALMEENRGRRAEMARLTVVDDLETVARESLGLASPAEGQIVIIR
jgi:hypothetical protein